MTTARQAYDEMADPDDVGASEYRLVHEHIGNVIASAEPAVAADPDAADELLHIVVASLDEVVSAARAAQRPFRECLARSEIEFEALRLESRINELLESSDKNHQFRGGVEVHGKLRRLRREADALPSGPDRVRAQEAVAHAARLLLTEVFQLPLAADQEVP